MPENSWKLAPGLHNVGSYQVSGKPYTSGSCLAPATGSALVVRFPAVTKWFQIEPQSGSLNNIHALRVAVSQNGLHGKGGYNFRIHASSSFLRPIDLKVSELWFMSEDSRAVTFDIVAGLTGIPAGRTNTANSASVNGHWSPDGVAEAGGPNWSGSIGVG